MTPALQLAIGAFEGLAIWVPVTLARFQISARRSARAATARGVRVDAPIERPVIPLSNGPRRIAEAKNLIADYETTVRERFVVACAMRAAAASLEQREEFREQFQQATAWQRAFRDEMLTELMSLGASGDAETTVSE